MGTMDTMHRECEQTKRDEERRKERESERRKYGDSL